MKPAKDKLTVCYVLSYYSPNYIRTRTLIEALGKNKRVIVYPARNISRGMIRYFQTLFRLIKIRLHKNPDTYILGFRGHEIYPLVRIITWNKPLIFDSMMSPFEGLHDDNKLGRAGFFISPLIYFLEKVILKTSALILVDTELHKKYLLDTFNLVSNNVACLYVGADDNLFSGSRKLETTSDFFNIFFYSTSLPLHGLNKILQAAAMVREKRIHFTIIGGKNNYFKKLCKQYNRRNSGYVTLKQWVEFEELPKYIENADLCLGGPFGNTPQARKVITGKTFQFIAMGKPTVIGSNDEKAGFVDKVNCLLVEQGDADDLARAILWAYNNQDRLDEIGRNARLLYLEKFSTDVMASRLFDILVRIKTTCSESGAYQKGRNEV